MNDCNLCEPEPCKNNKYCTCGDSELVEFLEKFPKLTISEMMVVIAFTKATPFCPFCGKKKDSSAGKQSEV